MIIGNYCTMNTSKWQTQFYNISPRKAAENKHHFIATSIILNTRPQQTILRGYMAMKSIKSRKIFVFAQN